MIQDLKRKVRKEALMRRQKAFTGDIGNSASLLSSVLAGFPCESIVVAWGYTELD